MKQITSILCLLLILPVISHAEKESMESRRARIQRKYLRGRTKLSKSDIVVHEKFEENEKVIDSEGFKDLDKSLSADDQVTPPPAPQPGPQNINRQQRGNENWLLAAGDEDDGNLYGQVDDDEYEEENDPYASFEADENTSLYPSPSKQKSNKKKKKETVDPAYGFYNEDGSIASLFFPEENQPKTSSMPTENASGYTTSSSSTETSSSYPSRSSSMDIQTQYDNKRATKSSYPSSYQSSYDSSSSTYQSYKRNKENNSYNSSRYSGATAKDSYNRGSRTYQSTTQRGYSSSPQSSYTPYKPRASQQIQPSPAPTTRGSGAYQQWKQKSTPKNPYGSDLTPPNSRY